MRQGFDVAYLKARFFRAAIFQPFFKREASQSAERKWLAARPKGTLDTSRTVVMPRWGIALKLVVILLCRWGIVLQLVKAKLKYIK